MRAVPSVVAVVQARLGSTRLPGKVLRTLGERSILEHVLYRLDAVPGLDRVVVATTDDAADEAVAEVAQRAGAAVTIGSAENVLARFGQAFREHGGTIGIRVTSDCPFLDATLVGQGLAEFRAAWPALDYLSNTLDRSYPRGYDFEVFRVAALDRAVQEATAPADREHVTPFLYRHPERFRLRSVRRPDPLNTAGWRLTLDTPEDWTVIRAVYDRLSPGRPRFGLAEVEALLAVEPDLLTPNRNVQQKT